MENTMAETTEEGSIWCLIATTQGEIARFSRDTAVYCFPPEWGDGGRRLRVIGHEIQTGHFIKSIVATKRLTDWRVRLISEPRIVAAMEGRWDGSIESRSRASDLAAAFEARNQS